MAILKTDYASGNIFTAGDTLGVSGINDITNRINTHTHDGTNTPIVDLQASYGSGIQTPISWGVDNVDSYAVISGVSVTLNARGKPFVCVINGNTGIDDVNANLSVKIHRSGTTAGESDSFVAYTESSAGDEQNSFGTNWIDVPTSGTAQVVYTGQVLQPGDITPANCVMGSVYMSVFELV